LPTKGGAGFYFHYLLSLAGKVNRPCPNFHKHFAFKG
jgi:hypothetical protein